MLAGTWVRFTRFNLQSLQFSVDGTFPGGNLVLLTGFFRRYPLGGKGLDLGVELGPVATKAVEIAEERTLVAGEGEEC